jgi:hypothetical protein
VLSALFNIGSREKVRTVSDRSYLDGPLGQQRRVRFTRSDARLRGALSIGEEFACFLRL